ncbi:TonB family protein [Rhizobium sp. 32-5/1]|uniref:energy transducer TonB family protein n=1 Tax=Rhizobium sp. 32-5/1 TaxID=3019602 RepID=UPI0032B82FE1
MRAKLQRALKYPRAADRNDVRDVPWVRFTVSATGAVSGVSVAKSSGSSLLDQAVIEAVHRASPFPPIPDSAGKSSLKFLIPLQFSKSR